MGVENAKIVMVRKAARMKGQPGFKRGSGFQ
jgi:hypothetical protein